MSLAYSATAQPVAATWLSQMIVQVKQAGAVDQGSVAPILFVSRHVLYPRPGSGGRLIIGVRPQTMSADAKTNEVVWHGEQVTSDVIVDTRGARSDGDKFDCEDCLSPVPAHVELPLLPRVALVLGVPVTEQRQFHIEPGWSEGPAVPEQVSGTLTSTLMGLTPSPEGRIAEIHTVVRVEHRDPGDPSHNDLDVVRDSTAWFNVDRGMVTRFTGTHWQVVRFLVLEYRTTHHWSAQFLPFHEQIAAPKP